MVTKTNFKSVYLFSEILIKLFKYLLYNRQVHNRLFLFHIHWNHFSYPLILLCASNNTYWAFDMLNGSIGTISLMPTKIHLIRFQNDTRYSSFSIVCMSSYKCKTELIFETLNYWITLTIWWLLDESFIKDFVNYKWCMVSIYGFWITP